VSENEKRRWIVWIEHPVVGRIIKTLPYKLNEFVSVGVVMITFE